MGMCGTKKLWKPTKSEISLTKRQHFIGVANKNGIVKCFVGILNSVKECVFFDWRTFPSHLLHGNVDFGIKSERISTREETSKFQFCFFAWSERSAL